jgi:hypothetical protein
MSEKWIENKCNLCAFTCKHKPNLKRHIANYHSDKDRIRIREHPEYGYNCPCHKIEHKFENAEDLRLHLYYFHRHGTDSDLKALGYKIEFI